MTLEFVVDFSHGFNFKTDKKSLCAVIILQESLNSQVNIYLLTYLKHSEFLVTWANQ